MHNRSLALTCLAISFLSAGCASFTDAELSQIQRRGVSSGVVYKFERGRMLTPSDVIELTARGVPDRYILRQIDSTGVDYALTREDVARLRRSRVSPAVIDALLSESDRFSYRYSTPSYVTYSSYYDPYGSYLYNPYPYYGYGGASFGFSSSRYHRHRRHR